jgi:hypothetical protein
VAFGPRVRVSAHLRLSDRDARLNRKLLRAMLSQEGLAELTISDMLPHDLDGELVRPLGSSARSSHLSWRGSLCNTAGPCCTSQWRLALLVETVYAPGMCICALHEYPIVRACSWHLVNLRWPTTAEISNPGSHLIKQRTVLSCIFRS